jgi:hypothetical protein
MPDEVLEKEKKEVAEKLRKEAVKVWCLNPIEAVARMQLGRLVEKYLLKFYRDDMDAKQFASVDEVDEAMGYMSTSEAKSTDSLDTCDWTLQAFMLGMYTHHRMVSKELWNVHTLDQMCHRIVEMVNSKNKPILEGSIKFVFRMSSMAPEFVLKMYYLEKA